MKIEEVGRMISTLRMRENISQEELCRGICSTPTLSRLEAGGRRPDILVFNALLQRLGKSADYINIVLALDEFEYIAKRRNVEISIVTGNFAQAEEELTQLEEELKEKGLSLQRQDLYRLYALLYLYKENNYIEAERYIYQALLETIPNFDKAKIFPQYFASNLRFSRAELQLLLLYAYVEERMGKKETRLLESIIRYIYLKITDKKAQNGELSLALRLQAYMYKKESLWKKCYECCENAIAAEVKNGGLVILLQVLEMEMECLENGVAAENSRLRKKQYEHLKEVLETYGKDMPQRKEFAFFLESTAQEKSLIDEVIRFSRLRGGYSQEELSEGICTPETLSRIETGRRNPSVRNFYALMQKSGLQMGYYNTELTVEQFETLEKIDELRHLIILKHFEDADHLLEEIEEEIDIDIVKNRQQIGLYHTVFDYRLGRTTLEEALKGIEELLELTMKRKSGKFSLQLQPTLVEISLLNQMAVYYRKMGNQKKSVEILMPLYEYFHQSKLEAPERSQKYFMIIGNLSLYLEEQGELEQALELIDKSINDSIKYNIGLRMGSNLLTKAYIQERLGEHDCLKSYEHSYYLCGLFEHFCNQNNVKCHVFKNWKITYED